MSFRWIFLANGLIGFLLLLVLDKVTRWQMRRELGKSEADERESQLLEDMAEVYDLYYGKKAHLMWALSTVLTMFFWEILLPGSYYGLLKQYFNDPPKDEDS